MKFHAVPRRLLMLTMAAVLTAAAAGCGRTVEERVAPEKVVTIAQGVDPESLDPAVDTLQSSVSTHSNIYDPLVWRDYQGELQPALATAWEFTSDTTLELSLRQGVLFHNGDAFTAEDVLFTFERLLDKDKPLRMSTYVTGLIARVEKVDDYSVRIHTPEPRPLLLAELTRIPIVPAQALKAMGADAFGQNPIGTGAFRFVKWDKNERIELEAFSEHWRGRPAVDRLFVVPIPEEFTRWAALKRGDVDIIANLPPERILEVAADPKLKVAEVHSARNMFVGMNTFKAPFNDPRVRQAMNYAVDVDSIIKHVLGNQAYRNPSVLAQPLFGYSPDVQPYPYDPKKAQQLLAEAGYPNGFTVEMWGPNGRYLKDKEVQEAIAGQLAKVGVKVVHVMPEWAEFWGAYSGKRIDGMAFLGTGNPLLDGDMTMGYRIHSARSGWYYTSPAVDALIEQERKELDPEKRKDIFREIQLLIREDAPWIFLYDCKDLYGLSARVQWEPRPDEIIWGYEIKVSD